MATSPLSAVKPEGWQAAPGSSTSGLQGTYGLWADAYREAAEDLGIEPRVLQSVTWEAKRRLMPDTMTTADRRAMDDVWREYHEGNASLEDTQDIILKMAKAGKGGRA